MALKPVKYDLEFDEDVDNESEQQQFQQQKEPGLLQQGADLLKKGGRFAKELGIEAVKAPLKLAETLVDVIPKGLGKAGEFLNPEEYRERFPSEEPVDATQYLRNKEGKLPSEQLGKALGSEEGYEPSNIASKSLINSVGNWPLLFFGPASITSKIGSDVAGSLGVETAKYLDLGPLAQVGVGVLSSNGFNKIAGLLKGSAKNPSKIVEHISKLYNEEKRLGDKIIINKPNLVNNLNNLDKKISGQLIDPKKFSSEAKRDILSNLDIIRSEIKSGGKLTGTELFDIKKNLNSIYSPKDSIQNNFYKDFRNIIKSSLEKDISKTPLPTDTKKWIDTWKTADELYKIQNWQTGLGRNLDKLASSGKLGKIVSNPTAQAGLALLAGKSLGTIPAGILGGAAALSTTVKTGESIKRSSDFIKELSKTKDGQKLMWDIVVDSVKDNTNALASNLNKLNKKAEKFEPDNDLRSVDEELEFLD